MSGAGLSPQTVVVVLVLSFAMLVCSAFTPFTKIKRDLEKGSSFQIGIPPIAKIVELNGSCLATPMLMQVGATAVMTAETAAACARQLHGETGCWRGTHRRHLAAGSPQIRRHVWTGLVILRSKKKTCK